MKKRRTDILNRVLTVAREVIKANRGYYSQDLLKLIPVEILNKRLTDRTVFEVSETIDAIRFKKEGEFAKKLGLSGFEKNDEKKKKLADAINHPLDNFPDEAREIRFLSNVAATVLHQ